MTRKARRKIRMRVSSRLFKKKIRRAGSARKKHCRFCSNPELSQAIDYKNATFLRGFLTERGKILPARISGNSCFCQRKLAGEIKRARTMALLPYCSSATY